MSGSARPVALISGVLALALCMTGCEAVSRITDPAHAAVVELERAVADEPGVSATIVHERDDFGFERLELVMSDADPEVWSATADAVQEAARDVDGLGSSLPVMTLSAEDDVSYTFPLIGLAVGQRDAELRAAFEVRRVLDAPVSYRVESAQQRTITAGDAADLVAAFADPERSARLAEATGGGEYDLWQATGTWWQGFLPSPVAAAYLAAFDGLPFAADCAGESGCVRADLEANVTWIGRSHSGSLLLSSESESLGAPAEVVAEAARAIQGVEGLRVELRYEDRTGERIRWGTVFVGDCDTEPRQTDDDRELATALAARGVEFPSDHVGHCWSWDRQA